MSNLKNRIIMRMRVSYLFSVFMFLLIGLYSCKDDNENPSPNPSFKITIDEGDTHPVISQQGGTINIPFTATGEWNATMINDRAESWITINPSSGKSGDIELSVTATANETYDERNATIVLQCGDDKKEIVVTQKQKDALTVTSSKYEVSSSGGNISVEVKANIEYEVEVKADWIKHVENQETRALTSSMLNFQVDFNDTGEKREGEIIIKNGELSETIKVYQEYEYFITLTQKDFSLPEEGGVVDIEIKSTVSYDVKMPSDVNWITEIQSRAVSTHTRHYQVEPNENYDPREAKIIFYNTEDETIADTVSIYQMYKGAILVARNEYQFGVKGGNMNLTVKSNLEFDVTISDEWIEKVDTRGLTEYNLTFNIKENTSGKGREGLITVKDKNSDKQQIVTVKQGYKDLEREALIAFYKATGGDNWVNNENWCSDKPLSEWYGVSTLIENGKDGKVGTIILDNNNLTGIITSELDNLSKLTGLYLSGNQLTGIQSGNPNIEYINCGENNIIKLDVTNQINLKSLDCRCNQIKELTVSDCPDLEDLICYDNLLSQIDVTKNTKLKSLSCSGNQIKTLVTKNCLDLKHLSCNNNQISQLEISTNSKLVSLGCGSNQITILNVNNCPDLESLSCDNNQISKLNVTKNAKLKELICHNNQITTLDVTNCPNLEHLLCSDNKISVIDVTNNRNLIEFRMDNNSLTNIDVTNNINLTVLSSSNNPLSSIDVSKNILLEELVLGGNQYAVIDVSELDLTNNTKLKYLICSFCQIESLDLSNNKLLETVWCHNNRLSSLDVSMLTNLKDLFCGNYEETKGNNLSEINISNNKSIERFSCNGMNIRALNLSNNKSLFYLECSRNPISSLDVSSNIKLEVFWAYKMQLSTLDVSNNLNLKWLATKGNDNLLNIYVSSNQNFSYDISEITNFVIKDSDSNQEITNRMPNGSRFNTMATYVEKVKNPITGKYMERIITTASD